MTILMHQVLELQGLCNKIRTKEISIKTAYKFSKIISSLSVEVNFFQASLQSIISHYGKKDADGNPQLTEDGTGIQIEEQFLKECEREIQELNEVKVELPEIYFTLDELEDFKFTINEMNVLLPLIKE